MNDRQGMVIGIATMALIVAALFYVPWRIESTGELTWTPFYRNPVVARPTYVTGKVESRYIQLMGRPVYGIYVLQLLAIGGAGAFAYYAARERPA
jgi:hypothetical protein